MQTIKPKMYHIDGYSKAAALVIGRYKDQPSFLYIAYRAPHAPLDAPKKYLIRFPGKMRERRRKALAMLSAVDDGVGLITEVLEKHQLTEKTLIFCIGDNGAPLKIHKLDHSAAALVGMVHSMIRSTAKRACYPGRDARSV